MKIIHFDCYAGISGDMALGALIDAGADAEILINELAKLALDFELKVSVVKKGSIKGTKVNVVSQKKNDVHRYLKDIEILIKGAGFNPTVEEKSLRVFYNLANAEAVVHGTTIEKIHFHEVGAIDSIIDIVGTIIALDMLEVEQVTFSPLPLGSGFVQCNHGILPIPAPAVLELLKGVPIRPTDIEGELVTPTGAALMITLATPSFHIPDMTLINTGYGAGTKDLPLPNFVRVLIGNTKNDSFLTEKITVLEAHIDDMNPEFFPYIVEKVLNSGALDVFLTPVLMKKGRTGQRITVLTDNTKVDEIAALIFSETTTLGIRYREENRLKLYREAVAVKTCYGSARVKIGKLSDGSIVNIAPEYEDCKKIASETGLPLKVVYNEVNNAFNLKLKKHKKSPQ